jgi:hypothetical protein
LDLPRRRRLVLLGSLGLIAVVAAAAVFVPLALPRAETSPTPNATQIAGPTAEPTASPSERPASATPDSTRTPTATDSPTPAPIDTPTPEPVRTSKPILAKGWPVQWEDGDAETPIAGPDGTIYLDEWLNWPWNGPLAAALDDSGHARPKWLLLPDDRAVTPSIFGPDGSVYVVVPDCPTDECTNMRVYAFTPDGSLRYTHPFAGLGQLLPGPGGTLHVPIYAGSLTDTEGDYLGLNLALTVLEADGTTRVSTNLALEGCPGFSNAALRPDGGLFVLCDRIYVFDPRGKRVSGTTTDTWQQVVTGPDGTIVAWGYDVPVESDEPPQGDIPLDPTSVMHLAVIGSDGRPAAGWPLTVKGAVSTPLIGPDGTIYLNRDAGGTQPPQILALGPDGKPRSGWPVALPAGYEDAYRGLELHWWYGPNDRREGVVKVPLTPTPGADGVVFIHAHSGATDAILAFDAAGSARPGWPVNLPGKITRLIRGGVGYLDTAVFTVGQQGLLFVPSPSGLGRLYVCLPDRILALTQDGEVVPGWPKTLPGTTYHWEWWAGMPDGGLAGLSGQYYDASVPTYTLTRWAPDGSLAK